MSNIQEIIQKTEPYLKMSMEKKTGKYGHEVVKITFHCPPGEFQSFQTRALEELRATLNVLSNMTSPEGPS